MIESLSEAECRRLLGRHTLGRVGMTSGGLPLILPVHYIYDDGVIVFRTGAGTKLRAAANGDVLAFEVDAYDAESGPRLERDGAGPGDGSHDRARARRAPDPRRTTFRRAQSLRAHFLRGGDRASHRVNPGGLIRHHVPTEEAEMKAVVIYESMYGNTHGGFSEEGA